MANYQLCYINDNFMYFTDNFEKQLCAKDVITTLRGIEYELP